MFAQINHVAICSPNWPMMARFYEAVFGLQASEKRKSRPISGANVGDGYVGLNINPLRDGYVGGLDHFGMTVEDVDAVMERARRKFSDSNIVKRPSTRPFAIIRSSASPSTTVRFGVASTARCMAAA